MLLFIGFYATAFQGAPFPLMCGTVMNGTAMNGTAMDGEYSYYPECCGPSIGSAPVTPGALRPSPPPCAASCASYPTDCDEATAITAPGGCVYGCTLDGGGDATTQAWLDGIAASLGCATGVRVVEGTLVNRSTVASPIISQKLSRNAACQTRLWFKLSTARDLRVVTECRPAR